MRRSTPVALAPLGDSTAAIEAHRSETLAAFAAERHRHMAAMRDAMLENAGILERFRRGGFDSYVCASVEQQRVLEVCQRYAQCFDQALAIGANLLLQGGTGTGKTHLACAVLASILDSGYSGVYTTLSNVLNRLRRARRPGRNEVEALASFTSPDLLVLDEAQGTIVPPQERQAMLFDLLDQRYAALRPTLVIANGSVAEMRAFFGARAFQRLTEQNALLLECRWPNYRRRAE